MNKHNFPIKKLSINKLYWSTVIALLAGGTSIGIGIIHQYKSSLKWKESPDANVALANQSIDMLYDKDPVSRANKIKFVKLYHKMIEKNGDLNTDKATPEAIQTYKYYYSHFNNKGSQVNYNKMYAEVLLKYSIQEQFDNLFTDDSHTNLEQNVTPMTIAKLNDSTFSDLTTLFVQNPNDEFVNRTIKLEKKLNGDIQKLNTIANDFNNAFSFNKNDVTLKHGYHGNISTSYEKNLKSLSYNWDSTKYMSSIVSMMTPIINWTKSQYSTYIEYKKDVHDKVAAYASWQAQKEAFFQKVADVHKAAVQEKHYQEQLERERKAAAKAARLKKEYDSGYSAGNSDGKTGQAKANLDGRSDKYIEGYNQGYKDGQAYVVSESKAESESKEQSSKDAASQSSKQDSSSNSTQDSNANSTSKDKTNSSSNNSNQSNNSNKKAGSSKNNKNTNSKNSSVNE